MKWNRAANLLRMLASYKFLGRGALSYPPQSTALEVTNRCCFTCRFCPQSDPQHFEHCPPCDLAPDEASLILDRLRRGGVTARSMHWSLGGEPFLNEQFPEIIARSIGRGFTNHLISTNGLLASPSRLGRFPANVQYTLYVDFCADEGTFEQVRGTPGSWECIRDNLAGIIEDQGLSHIKVRLTDISHWGRDGSHDAADSVRRLSALFGGRIPVDSREFHNMTGFLATPVPDRRARYVCPYPWYELIVASDGDVVACCRDLRHKTILGNLLRQELPDIWNGRRARQMRARLARRRPDRVAACAACDMPYDAGKLSLGNILKTALRRYQVLRIFSRQDRS